MASELQEIVRNLQLDFQGEDELQRICHRLQAELYALDQRPKPQIATPIDLSPQMQERWKAFQAFLAALCEYSGWVNRDQWIQLLDVAADLIAAGGGGMGLPGPQGPAGQDGLTPFIGTNNNWWIGTTDTGVGASGGGIGEAPVTGELYMRQGSTTSWQLLTIIDGGNYL